MTVLNSIKLIFFLLINISLSSSHVLLAQSNSGGIHTSPTGNGMPTVTPTSPGQTNSTGVNNAPGSMNTPATEGTTTTIPQPGRYQIEGAIKSPDGVDQNNNRTPLPSQGIPPTDSSRIKNDRSTLPTQGIPPTDPPGRITHPSLQN